MHVHAGTHAQRHISTHRAESHHQAWPALVPKPFPLICRQAPCLLVMRTGREAGPSSLPAPSGQAACTNLNCVSNDANSLAQNRLEGRERRRKIAQCSPSLSLAIFLPIKCVTFAHQQTVHLSFTNTLSISLALSVTLSLYFSR